MMERDSKRISPIATLFGRYGIEAGFLEPTPTGMEKGIMDATWPLREFLARKGIHDYRSQLKGSNGKRVLPIRILQGVNSIEGKFSLYRPETKNGDPRIWIYGLSQHASPDDIIALIVDCGQVVMVNCSREDLACLLESPQSPLGQMAARLNTLSEVASDLLQKLKCIGAMGFVESTRQGDTGIGHTLETMLGIPANAKTAPDFHGIELKSGRLGRGRNPSYGRHITLFSKKPTWEVSPYTARKTLETFGYRDGETGRLQLYCSVDAAQINSLGFKLEPRPEDDHLVSVNLDRIRGGEDVFLWLLDALKNSFAEKHRETFWVKAKSKAIGSKEHFHFVEARHTRNPSLSTFERLLATGGICVDLTMSERAKTGVRDHGYLFRAYGNYFDELFPLVAVHKIG